MQGKSILLRGGHAPGFLRDILCEAVDNFSSAPWVDALDEELGGAHLYGRDYPRWLEMSKTERALWLTGHLWHCTDIMPSMMCEELNLSVGSTYARAARLLRPTVARDPEPP
jgi:hypothetical protein